MQHGQNGVAQRGVLYLIVAGQPDFEFRTVDGKSGAVGVAVRHLRRRRGRKRAVIALAGLAEYGHDGFVLRRGHAGHARLDDARLFGGNGRKRVAQDGGVIQADGGDGADGGRDHIGGIQPSADAHLDDGVVHLLLGEIQKRQRRAQLKGRGIDALHDQRLGRGRQAVGEPDQHIIGHGRAVDAHPVVVLRQIGRGVQSRLFAAGAQRPLGQTGYRALAVGARDVDAGELSLRMFEGVEQRLHVQQAVFRAGVPLSLKPVCGLLRAGKCVHESASLRRTVSPPGKARGGDVVEKDQSSVAARPTLRRTLLMVRAARRPARSRPVVMTSFR